MKQFFLLAIVLMVLGCQNVKYPEKPENLIPKEKMIDVLTEVYLSNASRTYNLRVLRDSGYKLDSMLYKKFDIDSLQFAKSHAYYANDLDEYVAMFEKVKSKLEVVKIKTDTLKARYEERRRIKDSITRDSLRAIELKNNEDTLKIDTSLIIPALVKKDSAKIDVD